jgi:ankyrin repeat protein
LLLESGGDSVMNAQNNDGYTPLHFAVSTKLPQCCKQLLRAGSQASFSIRDENGKTPLEIAFQKRNNCRVVLLRYASSNR